jgi:hypothetical protein
VDILDVEVSLYDSGVLLGEYSYDVARNTFGFVGLASDVGFNQVRIGGQSNCGGGCIYQYHNIMLSPAAVPEPTILALMRAGLAGLGFARRRKR